MSEARTAFDATRVDIGLTIIAGAVVADIGIIALGLFYMIRWLS